MSTHARRSCEVLTPVLGSVSARILVCCVLIGGATQAFAAPPPSGMSQVVTPEAVKAAYLVKFRNYVEWPGGAALRPASAVVIGVMGPDEIVDRLVEISSAREASSGTVVVKHLRPGDALDGLTILFIDDSYWRRASATVAQAAAKSILVVTDSGNALSDGSVINFRMVDDRVRFEVSLDSAAHSGLKVSSQLLALATTVVREKNK